MSPKSEAGFSPRLMFIAGENSGDMHAAHLIRELRTLIPDVECFGFGGERMEAAGMRLDENLAQKLPIIGFTQALRNYGKLKSLLERAQQMLAKEKPDAVVLVDYPGFNLRTARAAKALGIPVIYYISPQIWAWNHKRIHTIAETVTRMLVILPFEEEIYRKAGVPAVYVGHPLNDSPPPQISREEILAEVGIAQGKTVIGLMPGSRVPEIVRHLPMMLETAELICKKMPGVEFLLPRASTIAGSSIKKYLGRHPGIPVHVTETDSKAAMRAMDFAICKSGTSTLELALAGVPMVIVYKVSTITYLLAKALIRIRWIGLVNIVANEEVAPELLQNDATPEKVAKKVMRIMNDPTRLASMRGKLDHVRELVGGSGASRRAAEEIAAVLRK